ncbi:MAG TPA: aminoglycoside phosphotransferase family protein [Streptomyces sp.]|nr:aminoglycoside phosphotransferase family protein [Streptomyces sp.]
MAVHAAHPGGRDEAVRFLRRAGIGPDDVVSLEPISGGTYNTLFRLRTADGRRLVLKIPPPHNTSGLQYELGLLHGETTYYRALAGLRDVPVPRIVHAAEADAAGAGARLPRRTGGFLLMTECPGASWSELSGELSNEERSGLRRSLGRTLAHVHTVRGSEFGYPAKQSGPLTTGWREAFTRMLHAVLEDAQRYAAWLPLSVQVIRALTDAAAPALDEVTTPVPVHLDLWEGNILITGAAGRRTVSGIVDGERMFWGDPLADFPSLLLFGKAEDDPDLIAGYLATAVGTDLDDAAARTRLALYRCYLYLIMLVETVPRASTQETVSWTHTHAAPALRSALDDLGHRRLGPWDQAQMPSESGNGVPCARSCDEV